MGNTIVSLTIPTEDQSFGSASDVSGLVGSKTVELSGTFNGSFIIFGSHDGSSYAPLLVFNSGSGAESPIQTTNVVVRYMKIFRKANNLQSVSCAVAAVSTTTNSFLTMGVIPKGTEVGPQPAIDTWALVPPTGLEQGVTAICTGSFTGIIALESSLDGVSFSPIGAFAVAPGQQQGLSPVTSTNTVRYLRLNILLGTFINGPVQVTIGGGLIATSTGGGGVTSWNGMTGAVKGTLEDIWAFGASDDPTNDNVFEMPSGNLRFPGNSQPEGLPGSAYFEKTTGASGDPRIGTDYQQRYYPTSQGIGGFVTDEWISVDPLWNGSFDTLGALTITGPLIGATPNTGETDANLSLQIARVDWQETSGFFNGPQAYPTPGFNVGHREDMKLYLFNGFTEGIFSHESHDFNGWGQHTCNTISTAQGVITAALNLSWWWGATPLAGDGLGIFFTLGTDDPPKGLISNTVLTTDIHGKYQLGFYTASNTNTLGSPIVTMDWTNGIVFHAGLDFESGTVGPGATAVAITNSPGVSANPVEYLQVKTASGTRFIALLA